MGLVKGNGMMKTATTIKLIPLASVKVNLVQPPTRTSATALAELLAAVKVSGEITPIEVTEDLVLIDGHRRVEVARILGYR